MFWVSKKKREEDKQLGRGDRNENNKTEIMASDKKQPAKVNDDSIKKDAWRVIQLKLLISMKEIKLMK